jgi:DNA-binding HxlR family transcriptional regulator
MSDNVSVRQESVDPSDESVTVFARNCLSRSVMEHVVTKWAVLALVCLRKSDFRFNALRRQVDGVSEKMLSQTLQTLERDGMVTRAVLTTIPPRVEYSITPLGAQVADRLRELIDLLEGSVTDVTEARRAYDARPS